MNKLIVALTIVVVIVGGFFIFNSTPNSEPTDEQAPSSSDAVKMGSARDAVFGYEFTYRQEPDGYITLEDTESTHEHFVAGIILFNKNEYEAFEQSDDAREGPPAMRMRLYQNPEMLHAPVWVERNKDEVNYGLLLGEVEEVVVGGANAVHFVTDGLFTTSVYVVANDKHIYVLTGDSFDTQSTIHKDFNDLVESFTFIQTPGQAVGKLDPRAACESALAYTLFQTGEQADQFIEECVNGEHPDVIDRYIESMGLDGATI